MNNSTGGPHRYSVIVPAYNEAGVIHEVVRQIRALARQDILEIIVVDDRSTDDTRHQAALPGVTVLSNVQNFGYGYSLKRGIAAATHEHIVILDADGSYPVVEIPRVMHEYEKGFDMVVGARQGSQYRGSMTKRFARLCFRLITEFATGRRIPDINSGCRVFRKDVAQSFFHMLSSGFSFTTTITLIYMLNAYSVQYIPIEYHKRHGKSKVKYVRDTLRSTQLIVEAISCYNPLKLYLLCASVIFMYGLICIVIGIITSSASWGLLAFLPVAFAVLTFSVGLIATFMKFNHSKKI